VKHHATDALTLRAARLSQKAIYKLIYAVAKVSIWQPRPSICLKRSFIRNSINPMSWADAQNGIRNLIPSGMSQSIAQEAE
jgi:hypothetical protein